MMLLPLPPGEGSCYPLELELLTQVVVMTGWKYQQYSPSVLFKTSRSKQHNFYCTHDGTPNRFFLKVFFPHFLLLAERLYPLQVPRLTTKEYKSNIWWATATQFRNQTGKRNLILRGALKQQMIRISNTVYSILVYCNTIITRHVSQTI